MVYNRSFKEQIIEDCSNFNPFYLISNYIYNTILIIGGGQLIKQLDTPQYIAIFFKNHINIIPIKNDNFYYYGFLATCYLIVGLLICIFYSIFITNQQLSNNKLQLSLKISLLLITDFIWLIEPITASILTCIQSYIYQTVFFQILKELACDHYYDDDSIPYKSIRTDELIQPNPIRIPMSSIIKKPKHTSISNSNSNSTYSLSPSPNSAFSKKGTGVVPF